jgi:hypothetical protein
VTFTLLLLVLTSAPGTVVWKSNDTLKEGADKTFIAKGTRKGTTYVFKARGLCKWQPKRLRTRRGSIKRDRPDRIFGIDFRVMFGEQEKQFLEVGEAESLETSLVFVADQNDMRVRVFDAFELPDKVDCKIDGLQIVTQ